MYATRDILQIYVYTMFLQHCTVMYNIATLLQTSVKLKIMIRNYRHITIWHDTRQERLG